MNPTVILFPGHPSYMAADFGQKHPRRVCKNNHGCRGVCVPLQSERFLLMRCELQRTQSGGGRVFGSVSPEEGVPDVLRLFCAFTLPHSHLTSLREPTASDSDTKHDRRVKKKKTCITERNAWRSLRGKHVIIFLLKMFTLCLKIVEGTFLIAHGGYKL